jgi:hypothetical protein
LANSCVCSLLLGATRDAFSPRSRISGLSRISNSNEMPLVRGGPGRRARGTEGQGAERRQRQGPAAGTSASGGQKGPGRWPWAPTPRMPVTLDPGLPPPPGRPAPLGPAGAAPRNKGRSDVILPEPRAGPSRRRGPGLCPQTAGAPPRKRSRAPASRASPLGPNGRGALAGAADRRPGSSALERVRRGPGQLPKQGHGTTPRVISLHPPVAHRAVTSSAA